MPRIPWYNSAHKSALAMLGTSESVARINQRLRRIDPDMPDNTTPYKEIPLTQGKVALVDAGDYERVSQFKWYAWCSRRERWYAQKSTAAAGKKGIVQLQVFILGAAKGLVVDHINGNGLDNRRVNLRSATNSQNSQNRYRQKNNTSGFRGVEFVKWARKWKATIRHNYKRIYLGYFNTPEEAASAYDKKAKELFGEHARPSALPREASGNGN